MKFRETVFALISMAGCGFANERGAVYDDPTRIWVLSELDGAQFEARATLQFPSPDRLAGDAPCNRYTGMLTATFPEFATGPIAATRRACPELSSEMEFYDALARMRAAEIRDDVLVLSGPDGQIMQFRADE